MDCRESCLRQARSTAMDPEKDANGKWSGNCELIFANRKCEHAVVLCGSMYWQNVLWDYSAFSPKSSNHYAVPPCLFNVIKHYFWKQILY